jgi:hypothetical protein
MDRHADRQIGSGSDLAAYCGEYLGPDAGAAPTHKVLVRRGPADGEVVRWVPPRAPGAQHIQDRIEVFPPPLSWAGPPTAWMLGHDEPGDPGPGGVGQV